MCMYMYIMYVCLSVCSCLCVCAYLYVLVTESLFSLFYSWLCFNDKTINTCFIYWLIFMECVLCNMVHVYTVHTLTIHPFILHCLMSVVKRESINQSHGHLKMLFFVITHVYFTIGKRGYTAVVVRMCIYCTLYADT